MGIRNYLIEGLSGTGKTTVAEELERRGFHVLHGDRILAYQGNPETGESLDNRACKHQEGEVDFAYRHHIWDVHKVKSAIADRSHTISFFCGGSRNSFHFINFFDGIFILEVDNLEVLYHRLDERVKRDPTDWGGKPEEKQLIERLFITKAGIPTNGIVIDATAPIEYVVDTILKMCKEVSTQ